MFALIVKIRTSIVSISVLTQGDVLWMRVLHSKYCKFDIQEFDGKCKAASLRIWRAIRSVWDFMEKGIACLIGDRNTIAFWKDRWIEGIKCLINHVIGNAF